MRLKAAWTVTAGIVPGEALPALTKRFEYTSVDYEADALMREGSSMERLAFHANFSKLRAEAMYYWLQMSNPLEMNWAILTFIWY